MTTALEHYRDAGHLWPHLFLAMPDHLHALLSFPKDAPMETTIRNWKRYIARQTKTVWQDGFFDHRLRSNESFEEKAHYIRQNPVREGLCATAETWEFVWPSTTAR